MKILITGSNGYVGRYLVDQIGHKHNIITLSRQKNHSPSSYTWEELDKIDWDKIKCIIHLAGKAHDGKNQNQEEYIKANVETTKKLLSHLNYSYLNKFIFFSSIKAATDYADIEITEDFIEVPSGPYGKSKLMAESLILNSLKNSKIEAIILRPSVIFGKNYYSGNIRTLSKLIDLIPFFPFGFSKNKKSITSLENLKLVMEKILISEVPSGVYNLCDDKRYTTSDLIKRLSKRNVIVSNLILELYYLQLSKLGIKVRSFEKMIGSNFSSNQKLKSVLNIGQL